MTITRSGSAVWEGGLREGKGRLSTESGTLSDTPYGFTDRFERGASEPSKGAGATAGGEVDGGGTNPEELIASAHAGCFSMALSGQLAKEGIEGTIRTTADATMEKDETGWVVTKVQLDVEVEADGEDDAIQQAAENAKAGCPVSRLLTAEIGMDVRVK